MEKHILFSGEMVKSILNGRKTQTRRVIKPQPEKCGDGWIYNNVHFADDAQMQSHLFHDIYGNYKCPYGGVYSDGTGDTLWVREMWATPGNYDHIKPSLLTDHMMDAKANIVYRATEKHPIYFKWRPSIFMPRWASRIILRVVNVRVEQVQDISEEDVVAEGVTKNLPDGWIRAESHRMIFKRLWNSINGTRGCGWDSNPWVWVVEFEVVS